MHAKSSADTRSSRTSPRSTRSPIPSPSTSPPRPPPPPAPPRPALPAPPGPLPRDPVGELLEVADLDRALVRRTEHSADELVAVELLAPAVALAHHEHRALDPLVGREALLAARAFAPATDRVARLGEAGIHHARRFELA